MTETPSTAVPPAHHVREVVRSLLSEQCLSQAELARRMQMDPATLSKQLRGTYAMPIETLLDMAAVLRVQPGYFLQGIALHPGRPPLTLVSSSDDVEVPPAGFEPATTRLRVVTSLHCDPGPVVGPIAA